MLKRRLSGCIAYVWRMGRGDGMGRKRMLWLLFSVVHHLQIYGNSSPSPNSLTHHLFRRDLISGSVQWIAVEGDTTRKMGKDQGDVSKGQLTPANIKKSNACNKVVCNSN